MNTACTNTQSRNVRALQADCEAIHVKGDRQQLRLITVSLRNNFEAEPYNLRVGSLCYDLSQSNRLLQAEQLIWSSGILNMDS